jgi:sec-independent protein translocase protein TatA
MPGFIGFPEILLLGLLALILFGPKRLPEMGRGLGKGMREFKDSLTGESHSDQIDVAKLEIPTDVPVTAVERHEAA